MSAPEDVIFVPEMNPDSRIRVYRAHFSGGEAGAGMEVDGYLILTQNFVLICDTLLCPENMATITQAIQNELGERPLLVMNSHADWDHAWGNSYFTGEHAAPIIAHELCRTRLTSEETHMFLDNYQKNYPEQFRNVVLTPPAITFTDKLTLSGGDLTIELFSSPGHCSDHIAAWISELQLLLAFDALENPIPIVKDATGVQAMFATLERFQALQPQLVRCSHGRVTDPTIITANLTYFRKLEQLCRTALAHHQPTSAELEHASTLIHYSLDDVLVDVGQMIALPEPLDRTFYGWAHDSNARAMMQWLMQEELKSSEAH